MELDPVVLEAFSGLKKKKKQIKQQEPIEQDEEEVIEQTQEPIEQTENLFGDLKKKKKKKKIVTEVVQEQEPTNSVGDYTYQELLTRVYAIIREANPELSGEKGSYKIVPPQILREGTKKTAFANIIDISKRMKRAPDHVIQFLFAELGTSGSIDGNQRLVIKGRFQQKQIETVLKRYIMEYVSCKTCKSAETVLTKENRMFFVQCESCGSSRSVSAIKTGFVAQTKRIKPTE